MVALHRPGEGLETDVVGAAVAAEGDKFVRVGDLPFFLQHTVGRLHAAQGRPGVFKGVMDVAVLPGCVRVHESRNLHTARGIPDHCPVALVESAQDIPGRDRAAAACTHPVSGSQTLRFAHCLFKIKGHDLIPVLSTLSVPDNGTHRSLLPPPRSSPTAQTPLVPGPHAHPCRPGRRYN